MCMSVKDVWGMVYCIKDILCLMYDSVMIFICLLYFGCFIYNSSKLSQFFLTSSLSPPFIWVAFVILVVLLCLHFINKFNRNLLENKKKLYFLLALKVCQYVYLMKAVEIVLKCSFNCFLL